MITNILPLVFFLFWVLGIGILKIGLKRIQETKKPQIFYRLHAIFLSLFGTLPAIFIKLHVIEKSLLNVLIGIIYFITFVFIASFLLIRKANSLEE